jgi:hypothetical protein
VIHSLLDDSLSIVRLELDQLRYLLHIIGKGIRAEMSDVQNKIDESRKTCPHTHPLEDQRDDDEVIGVADLGRYENYIGIVMAVVVYERFLMESLNIAEHEIDGLLKKKERQLRDWPDYVRGFQERFDIDLRREPFSGLKVYKTMRNTIAHQGAQTLGERRGSNYVPGIEISITSSDVTICIELVEKCCNLIHEKYRAAANPKLEEVEALRNSYDPFADPH